jgi:hypothetical protein
VLAVLPSAFQIARRRRMSSTVGSLAACESLPDTGKPRAPACFTPLCARAWVLAEPVRQGRCFLIARSVVLP